MKSDRDSFEFEDDDEFEDEYLSAQINCNLSYLYCPYQGRDGLRAVRLFARDQFAAPRLARVIVTG
jgi:hypothetical protein